MKLAPIDEKDESDELAKIQAIEIEFMQFVLPWLKLVPKNSGRSVAKVYNKIFLAKDFQYFL